MNILNTHKTGTTLEVTVHRALNLWTKNMIESRLSDEIDSLQIDLTSCPFIDSEGVMFMYRWQQEGHKLRLINPPEVLFEILDILELKRSWTPDYITTNNH